MSEQAKEMVKQEIEAPMEAEHPERRRTFIPRVDIYEADDTVIIQADMPGVDEHTVEITLEKNLLTIQGQAKMQSPDGHKLAYNEYRLGDYLRSFTLTDEVDRDLIEASMSNGVLRLILPKAEAAKSRKIAVQIAS